MFSENSTKCGLCGNRQCMCHMPMVPWFCPNPMTQYWYNNAQPSSSSFLYYQRTPENTMYGFHDASNPVNSWLEPNQYNNQFDRPLNGTSYYNWNGNPDHGQFGQMQTQGIHVNNDGNYGQSSREGLVEQQEQTLMFFQGFQNEYSTSPSLLYPGTSLQPAGAEIIPEATIGTMNLPQEWLLTQLGFSPFLTGNLVEETVGSHSNSTISSLGTQQLSSSNDLTRVFRMPPTSRHERILRYLEKKKSRKYDNIIHSSRKLYAQTRPRVRGRFSRSSQTDHV